MTYIDFKNKLYVIKKINFYFIFAPLFIIGVITFCTLIVFSPRWQLYRAIKKNNINDAIEILSKNKNIVNKIRDGLTPLHEAAFFKRYEIVKALIDRGANPNARAGRHKYTPLFVSADLGDLKTIKILLDHGAKINISDTSNETPLMSASSRGHSEIVKLLIIKGANINARSNNYNRTAFDYAVINGHVETAKVLRKYGAAGDFNKLIDSVEDILKGMPNADEKTKDKFRNVLKFLKKEKIMGCR